MDMTDYQIKAMRTKSKLKGFEEEVLNASLGLAGEVGECVDHIKKVFFHGHDLDKDYLENELGDILWYVALMSHALDIPMGDIGRKNIEKLERRYPEGFDKNHSINRSE